jgi:hypothetical protein
VETLCLAARVAGENLLRPLSGPVDDYAQIAIPWQRRAKYVSGGMQFACRSSSVCGRATYYYVPQEVASTGAADYNDWRVDACDIRVDPFDTAGLTVSFPWPASRNLQFRPLS